MRRSPCSYSNSRSPAQALATLLPLSSSVSPPQLTGRARAQNANACLRDLRDASLMEQKTHRGSMTAAREVKTRKTYQDSKNYIRFLINNREENSSHDGWCGPNDLGLWFTLQAAIWSGKSSVCISAGCRSTLRMNAALDSFGGKSQKKVMR